MLDHGGSSDESSCPGGWPCLAVSVHAPPGRGVPSSALTLHLPSAHPIRRQLCIARPPAHMPVWISAPSTLVGSSPPGARRCRGVLRPGVCVRCWMRLRTHVLALHGWRVAGAFRMDVSISPVPGHRVADCACVRPRLAAARRFLRNAIDGSTIADWLPEPGIPRRESPSASTDRLPGGSCLE